MKAQILIKALVDEDQKIFNSSNFLVNRFGRKLQGFAEHIWIDDMELFLALCEILRSHNRHPCMRFRAKFNAEEESKISHKIVMFPGIKMSEKDHDFVKAQVDEYVDSSVVKDHGGYSPVIIADKFELRSKINVSEGKVNEVAFNELIATCDTINSFIREGAELIDPEPVGFNREGARLSLLKSNKLAPPVQLDEAMVRYENWDKYLIYYPVGIPSFKGLNSISSFARMRDSLVATRSPLWILEKSWIEKLKKMGCRPKTIPVMESGTELRKNYIDMLISIKEIVATLPGSTLSVADL
jgi:hypothetical protein